MDQGTDQISSRLIDETYAATLDPMRYDALMDAWLAYIEAVPADEAEAHFKRDGMYIHFQRALTILDRMGRTQARDDSAAAIAAQMPGVGVVLNAEGQVLGLNDGARKLSAANLIERLSDLNIEPDAVDQVEAWLDNESRAPGRLGFLFLPCRVGREHQPSCLLVTPISLSKSNETDATEEAFLLATVDVQLDGAVAESLQTAYGLSSAETEVALQLAEGLQPQEIADVRAAKLTTIRSQIRSILNKLQARNTTDAVRTITGLAANFTTARAVSRASPPLVGAQRLRRIEHMILSDGRRLTRSEQGDFEGKPLLFFHNMLY
ncbi:MAG: helix-turn-helix transcriptional regulator, partial [Pseudomonadota bacterium]